METGGPRVGFGLDLGGYSTGTTRLARAERRGDGEASAHLLRCPAFERARDGGDDLAAAVVA